MAGDLENASSDQTTTDVPAAKPDPFTILADFDTLGLEDTGPASKDLQGIESKPTIIGIYGVTGCGKSYPIQELKNTLDVSLYKSTKDVRSYPRLLMAAWMASARFKTPTSVFTGDSQSPKSPTNMQKLLVWTQQNAQIFTHIIYLQNSPSIIATQRKTDSNTNRSVFKEWQLKQWQEAEMKAVKGVCLQQSILYTVISGACLASKVSLLLEDFRKQNEATQKSFKKPIKTMVVFDADGTIVASDSGKEFWQLAKSDGSDPLKDIFSSVQGYSYSAVRQAILRYTEMGGATFSQYSSQVARKVGESLAIEQKFWPILTRLAQESAAKVNAIVVTCGLKCIWDDIFAQDAATSRKPHVFGASHPLLQQDTPHHSYVVTPLVKAKIVERLQQKYGCYVWAFGDGQVDPPMLQQADQAMVVTRGIEDDKRRAMDEVLARAIKYDNLLARQLLVMTGDEERQQLVDQLPIVHLTDKSFIDEIYASPAINTKISIFNRKDYSAVKILYLPPAIRMYRA